MKYHRLNQEQLNSMYHEFSLFLAAQSIDKKSWDSIKTSEPKRVGTLLDQFSDMVWERVLEKCAYLEWTDQQQLFLFESGAATINVFILKLSNPEVNSDTPEGWQWMLDHFFTSEVTLFQSSKSYDGPRNLFLYDYIRKGAVISQGERYKQIATFFSKSSK